MQQILNDGNLNQSEHAKVTGSGNSMEPFGGFLKSKPELSRHLALRACSPYENNTFHDAVHKQVNSVSAQREDILPNTRTHFWKQT